jgi:hypothetical protein
MNPTRLLPLLLAGLLAVAPLGLRAQDDAEAQAAETKGELEAAEQAQTEGQGRVIMPTGPVPVTPVATPPGPPPTPAPATGTSDPARRATGQNLMLRLTPENMPDTQNMDVIEGAEFITDILLVNPVNRPVDHLRVVLDFNPAYFSPMAINDSPIKNQIAGGMPRALVDRARGQIIYEADLDPPLGRLPGPILFVRWQALKPVFFSPITFGRDRQGRYSDLFRDQESILGESYEQGDGTVSMTVTIIPADPDEARIMAEDPHLYLGSSERVGGVVLSIEPPARTPRVGEEFTLDIVLDNRAHSQLDGISLLIQYDPKTLQILDDDRDNWITLGLNIHDGSFRSTFPFDYHMANAVYPIRGLIEYRVGTSTPQDLIGIHGTFARIRARALAPTAGTTLKFLFSPRPGSRTTAATYLGQDVLGDTRVRNDGVRGVHFPILP